MEDHRPHPDFGYWAARTVTQTLATAAVVQQAQNNANQIALANAAAASMVSQSRVGLANAVSAHIGAVMANPIVATNPDAMGHLAAAEQILATIT